MRKQLQNVAEVFCSKSDDGLDIKLKIVGGVVVGSNHFSSHTLH